MNSHITITEVIGRSEQGMTRPFVCTAGFFTCYVKGAYAGRNSLCCEWVAGRLADLMLPSAPLGLPMFRMAEVPHALIEGSARPDIRDLGEGLVFASMRIDDGQELTWSAAQGWPEETMAMLLLLDLWLQNEDRSLTALAELPPDWLHVDGDDSLPVQLDEKRVTSVLELPFTNPDSFWKLP